MLQDVFEICKHLEEIFDGHKDRKITELEKQELESMYESFMKIMIKHNRHI